jgi:hypothetical protein
MRRFLLGFLAASVIWLGLLYAQSAGWLVLFGPDEPDAPATPALVAGAPPVAEAPAKAAKKPRRSKRKQGQPGATGAAHAVGEGSSGDDLGGAAAQELALQESGGQEQLSAAEIDAGIDRVWNGIQRCLVLIPPGLPATGNVVVGMRIAPSGEVTRANLKGPGPIVQGEAGGCIRRHVQSIRYRAFDGPEMLAHYPIVFE